jgi:hypothetical protein
MVSEATLAIFPYVTHQQHWPSFHTWPTSNAGHLCICGPAPKLDQEVKFLCRKILSPSIGACLLHKKCGRADSFTNVLMTHPIISPTVPASSYLALALLQSSILHICQTAVWFSRA